MNKRINRKGQIFTDKVNSILDEKNKDEEPSIETEEGNYSKKQKEAREFCKERENEFRESSLSEAYEDCRHLTAEFDYDGRQILGNSYTFRFRLENGFVLDVSHMDTDWPSTERISELFKMAKVITGKIDDDVCIGSHIEDNIWGDYGLDLFEDYNSTGKDLIVSEEDVPIRKIDGCFFLFGISTYASADYKPASHENIPVIDSNHRTLEEISSIAHSIEKEIELLYEYLCGDNVSSFKIWKPKED